MQSITQLSTAIVIAIALSLQTDDSMQTDTGILSISYKGGVSVFICSTRAEGTPVIAWLCILGHACYCWRNTLAVPGGGWVEI